MICKHFTFVYDEVYVF